MKCNLSPKKDTLRATALAISDASKLNQYTVASSFAEIHPISLEHNRRLIHEIIDRTFDEQKGVCEVSSSQCSSIKLQASEYSFDKRLLYWQNVLKERQKLSSKIHDRTKKNPCDILYNRLACVDERDKFTVRNLMDYAERLNPTALSAKQLSTLKEKCNSEMLPVPELQETLPLAEKSKTAKIEITGLPKEIQKEVMGEFALKHDKKPFSWLNSMYLEKRITEKGCDIERVLEFYPDTDDLQILGKGLFNCKETEYKTDIKFVSGYDVCKISTDTAVEEEINEKLKIGDEYLETFEYAVKINDQEFFIGKGSSNKSLQTLTNFKCLPFQTEIKKIFTIENIGKKILDFQWQQSTFYKKNYTLLKCCDNEFIFDNLPFRLCSGEVQEIFVKFQPRKVSVVKSQWILKIKPSFFTRKSKAGVFMKLSGECTVPLEYAQKLDEMQREVITKSNQLMIKTLTLNLADLAVEAQPADCNCPYQRSLNEMEIFEQINGFKCERFYDLELLKDLYKRVKKPRDKMWDFEVNTLKSTILKVPQNETRALLFNEFIDILNSIKESSLEFATKISETNERDRGRFLYVRGIISTALDEWLNLATTLEETFYQTTFHAIKKERENNTDSNSTLDEAEIRQYVLENRLHKRQPYYDSFYLKTYTLLCNFAENIVNVIESNT